MVAVWCKIVVGYAIVVLLAVPISWLFGRSAAWGYLFGLLMMVAYLLYLLLFVEGPTESR